MNIGRPGRRGRAALGPVRLVLLAVATVVVGVLGIWWGTRPTVMRAYYRFVEPALKAKTPGAQVSLLAKPRLEGGTSLSYATANIGDETRYVLSSPASAMLQFPRVVTVPPDGHLPYSLAIPVTFGAAQRVVLTPSVKRGIKWSTLPSAVVPIQGSLPRRTVQMDLTLPPEDAGTSVKVRFDGTAIAEGRTTSWRTGDVRIPSGARLDFGVGILPAAWPQGPAEFTLKACASNDCEVLFSETLDPATPAGQSWQDRSVPLDHLRWRTRAFVFEAHAVRGDKGSFSFPVWANPTLSAASARSSNDANVILLSIDTLSAEHLKTYGYQHDTAPFIDQTFGKQGTVSEHCVTASTTTPGSHMTMLTSVPPSVHGVHDQEVLPPWLTTLAETLRGGGFETGAVTEDGWLSIVHGFGRGFNSFAENKSPDVMLPEGQAELTFHKAKDWLGRNRDKRFFLFLHTFQVHGPYTPPASYANLFGSHDGQPITSASPQPLQDLANYDREIRFTDDLLRLLFEAIKADGLDGNTIFILVADHGEEFGEHGLLGHGAHFFEEVTRVPMLFWGPGRIPAGRRITGTVGLIDLMPTILDLAGVPKPEQAMGVSLADLLRNESPAHAAPERRLFSEAWVDIAMLPDQSLMKVERPGFMVQVGTRKLARYRRDGGFAYELYDVAQDPQERHNLYEDGAKDAVDLRAEIDGYQNTCTTTIATLAASSRSAASTAPRRVQLDPAQEEKLRALGYLH